VAKLEAFGQGPQTDLVLEFDKIPTPILELFNIGSHRSSNIDSEERLAAMYKCKIWILLRCAYMTTDNCYFAADRVMVMQDRHAGRLANPGHAGRQPAAVPA